MTGATNLQLWELENGLDELASWVRHQKSLPESDRAIISTIMPTYLRTKSGWVITLKNIKPESND